VKTNIDENFKILEKQNLNFSTISEKRENLSNDINGARMEEVKA
jgi:hypothetical protein